MTAVDRSDDVLAERLVRDVAVDGDQRVDFHYVRVVRVQYGRGGELGPEWLVDWVTLFDSNDREIVTQFDTRQRGHRTEGIFGTLRYVGLRRPWAGRSRADRDLDAMPLWLDELVAHHLPGQQPCRACGTVPDPGPDGPPQCPAVHPDGWCCAVTGVHEQHANAAGDVTWGGEQRG